MGLVIGQTVQTVSGQGEYRVSDARLTFHDGGQIHEDGRQLRPGSPLPCRHAEAPLYHAQDPLTFVKKFHQAICLSSVHTDRPRSMWSHSLPGAGGAEQVAGGMSESPARWTPLPVPACLAMPSSWWRARGMLRARGVHCAGCDRSRFSARGCNMLLDSRRTKMCWKSGHTSVPTKTSWSGTRSYDSCCPPSSTPTLWPDLHLVYITALGKERKWPCMHVCGR